MTEPTSTLPPTQIGGAVIGTGFIGTVHAEAIRRVGAQLAGVLGSSPERGRAAAERIGTTAFSSLEELLDSDVQVVHVASPNSVHAEHTLAAIAAGKHVICEKPLATGIQDAKRMFAAAEQSGLVHATCFNFRFYPVLHDARARCAAGDLGRAHRISGSYLQDWLLKPTDWNWRLDQEVGGQTRAVADIGSHWLDLAQFVSGQRITRVLADLQTVHPTRLRPAGEVQTFTAAGSDAALSEVEISNDDAGALLLRFDGGAHGVAAVSQTSAGRKNNLSLMVDGDTGSLSWISSSPDELWLGHRDAPNQLLSRDPGSMAPEAARISFYPIGHVEGFGESFRGLFQQVYADVLAGGPQLDQDGGASYPTLRDGLRAMLIDDAIRASAESGSWVDVEGI